MNFHIFGDPLAKELGRSLIEYFESEGFPMELLRDPELNFLYFKLRFGRLIHDKTLNDSNLLDCLDDIIIAEIKLILDDRALTDPECFHRIEAIVNSFRAHGIRTSRHDWG